MALLPDASHLPVGMVLLPDGSRETVETFFRLHGSALAAYPDAQIAVLVPAYHPSQNAKDMIKGVVTAVSGILVGLVVRGPTAGRIVSGAVGGYVVADISDWIARAVTSNASVKILTVREISGRGQ